MPSPEENLWRTAAKHSWNYKQVWRNDSCETVSCKMPRLALGTGKRWPSKTGEGEAPDLQGKKKGKSALENPAFST